MLKYDFCVRHIHYYSRYYALNILACCVPLAPPLCLHLVSKVLALLGICRKLQCAVLHALHNLELMTGQKSDANSFRDMDPQMLDLNPNPSFPKNFTVCLQIFLRPSV